MPGKLSKNKPINIIAVETSCDETAISAVRCSGGLNDPRFSVIANIVFSQADIHRAFGGVVPNIAKREHEKSLPILWEEISKKIAIKNKVDLFAVTSCPGLEPALWTGIEFMRVKAKEYKKPLAGANHLRGHLMSFLLERRAGDVGNLFPAIALIVSGGHTMILRIDSLSKWKKLGETRDDAAGETFDKGARLLGLPYPGGPEISKLAFYGDPKAVAFPRPMIDQKNCDMSFAGLKTALLYYLKQNKKADWKGSNANILNPISIEDASKNKLLADTAASFETAIVDTLVIKTLRAVDAIGAKSVLLSGGVAANSLLRSKFIEETKKRKIKFFAPGMAYNTDNAAMIAVASYIDLLRNKKTPLKANGHAGI